MLKKHQMFVNAWYALKIVFSKAPLVASVYLLLALTGSVFTVLQIVFLQKLVDAVFYINEQSNYGRILWTAIIYVFSVFLSQIYTFSMSKAGEYLYKRLSLSLSPAILDRLNDIEYRYFEDPAYYDIMSKIGDDPQQMLHNAFFSVATCLNGVTKLIGILLVFFKASIMLGIGAVAIGVPMALLEISSTNKQQKLDKETTPEKRKVWNLEALFEDKNALYEFKVFQCFPFLIQYWRGNREIIKNRQKGVTRNTILARVVVCAMKILYGAFVVSLLGVKLFSGQITLGTFVSLVSSIEKLYGILNTASYSLASLGARTYNVEYYRKFLEFDKRISGDEAIDAENLDIEFRNVHFRYPNSKEEILKGVSFKIPEGQCTALVGINGAGKSTIIKLLCGLYQPSAGEILIGGKNVSSLSEKELKKAVVVAFQDFGKYEFTLRENVALGNLNDMQNDFRLMEALESANFEEGKMIGLDQRLGHLFEDGRELSGGQWQKVAIARTLISDSKFLVMDEPTSALDPVAESKMYANFAKLAKGRGAIIISHRLASAKMADHILVIGDGVIQEEGSHDTLMKLNGKYAKMFEMQRSWYEVNGYEQVYG